MQRNLVKTTNTEIYHFIGKACELSCPWPALETAKVKKPSMFLFMVSWFGGAKMSIKR